MTYGLVTGMGRSGSMWVAHALSTATDLDARHESRKKLGEFCACPGAVEVNSHWRYSLEEYRAKFPRARIVHLVRDGRDVVRSAMARKGWTFAEACWEWREAVRLVEPAADITVPLEGLVAPDKHSFRIMLCTAFGADYDPQRWEPVLADVKNATGAHSFPHWKDWTTFAETFWRICGEQMQALGYA